MRWWIKGSGISYVYENVIVPELNAQDKGAPHQGSTELAESLRRKD
jgi:hypothetical protein